MSTDIPKGKRDGWGGKAFIGGALGTWAKLFGAHFADRNALVNTLATQLSRDWYGQNYVGEHFMLLIPRIGTTPAWRNKLIAALQEAVRNDAKVVKNNLSKLPPDWKAAVDQGFTVDNAVESE
ncbi:MAG: hypothetical protein AB1941_25595 [Gemmatimonadota bacterium]